MKDWTVELADENTGDLVKVYVIADSKEDAIDGAWFELSEEGEDVNNYTLIDAYSNFHLYAISKDGKIYSGNSYEDIISNKPTNFFSIDDSIKGYIDKNGKFYDEDGNSFESGGSVYEYTDDIWSFEAKVSDVNFYYEESWVKNMLPENSQIEFVKGENFKVKYRNVIDINPEGIDGGTPYIEEVSGTVVVEYSLREDEDLEIIELDFKTDADWNLKVLRNKGCIATTIDSLEINFKNKEVEVDFAGDSKGEWDSYEEGGELFNYLSTPITYQVFDENEIVLRTKSFNKAVDYRTLNGKHLKIVAIDKNGNSKVIASKEYAEGGGIKKKKNFGFILYDEYFEKHPVHGEIHFYGYPYTTLIKAKKASIELAKKLFREHKKLKRVSVQFVLEDKDGGYSLDNHLMGDDIDIYRGKGDNIEIFSNGGGVRNRSKLLQYEYDFDYSKKGLIGTDFMKFITNNEETQKKLVEYLKFLGNKYLTEREEIFEEYEDKDRFFNISVFYDGNNYITSYSVPFGDEINYEIEQKIDESFKDLVKSVPHYYTKRKYAEGGVDSIYYLVRIEPIDDYNSFVSYFLTLDEAQKERERLLQIEEEEHGEGIMADYKIIDINYLFSALREIYIDRNTETYKELRAIKFKANKEVDFWDLVWAIGTDLQEKTQNKFQVKQKDGFYTWANPLAEQVCEELANMLLKKEGISLEQSEDEYASGGGVGDINMEFLKVFRQYGFINSYSYGHNAYENKNKDIIVFSPKSDTIGKGWLTLQLSNNMEERLHLKPFTTSALIDLFNKYGLLPTVNKGELSYTLYSNGGGVGEIKYEITKEELELKIGRKLNGWNDDKVEYNGVTYVKCFLKPHYKIA